MPGELASVAKPALNIAKKLVTTPEAQQLGARALEGTARGVAALASRPGLVGSVAAPAVSAASEQAAHKLAPKLTPAERFQNLVRTNPQILTDRITSALPAHLPALQGRSSRHPPEGEDAQGGRLGHPRL